MKREINKQLILEAGHIILEAVHSNHPSLDKSRLKDPNISDKSAYFVKSQRKKLAKEIRSERERSYRDKSNKNLWDNISREISQTGGVPHKGKERTALGEKEFYKMVDANPRMVQSARQ